MSTVLERIGVHTERMPNRHVDERLVDRFRLEESRRFREMLHAANAAAERPQHDGYVTRLMQRIQKGTLRLAEHLMVLVRNWYERQTPRAILEAPFHCALAIIASWYPAPDLSDLKALSRAETIAQGPADVVQIDIDVLEGPALFDAERKIAADYEATGNLLAAVRLKAYAVQLPPAA